MNVWPLGMNVHPFVHPKCEHGILIRRTEGREECLHP
jgi:hypothetical protein